MEPRSEGARQPHPNPGGPPAAQRREPAKPGTTGRGDHYHVIGRPEGECVTFRTQTSASQVASNEWLGSGPPARGLGAFR